MIVGIKRSKQGLYNVTVWSSYGYPFSSYSNVKVYVDNKVIENFEELFIEVVRVKYIREKAELHIYTKHVD